MKFNIKSEDFIMLGNSVLKNPNKEGTICGMKIENNKMILISYSNSTYFKGSIEVNDIEDYKEDWYDIEPQTLKSLLSVLPNDHTIIHFNTDKIGFNFTLSYGKTKLKLQTSLGDIIQDNENYEEIYKIDALTFTNTLNKMTKLVENDNGAGGSTTCVHLYLKNKNITFMATNQIGLAEVKIDLEENVKDELIFLLRGSEAHLLSNKKYDIDDEITLIKSNSKFGFIDKNGFINLVGIVDEIPIEYEGILDTVAKEGDLTYGYNAVILNTESLKNAISNIGKISPLDKSIYFNFNSNGLILKSEKGDEFEVISNFNKEDSFHFSIHKNTLQNFYSLWDKYIKITFTNQPYSSIIQFKLLKETTEDNSFEDIENIWIGVSADDE